MRISLTAALRAAAPAALLMAAMTLTACGSDDGDDAAPAAETTTQAAEADDSAADEPASGGAGTDLSSAVTPEVLGSVLVDQLPDAEGFDVDGDVLTVTLGTDLESPDDAVQCQIASVAADAFDELDGISIRLKMPSSELDCSTL